MERENGGAIALETLRGLLVNEFRAYQSLVELTKSERTALTAADIDTLSMLVEQKETLLDEIQRLEQKRIDCIDLWAQEVQWTAAAPSILDILSCISRPVAARLQRIRAGILTLASELKELTRGNRALALAGLERVDMVRTFLISSEQPADHYHPSGKAMQLASATSLEVEEWV